MEDRKTKRNTDTCSSRDNRGSKIDEERTGKGEREENRKRNETERRGETIRRDYDRERGQRRDRTRIEIENRKGKTRETNRNQTYKGASIETG